MKGKQIYGKDSICQILAETNLKNEGCNENQQISEHISGRQKLEACRS